MRDLVGFNQFRGNFTLLDQVPMFEGLTRWVSLEHGLIDIKASLINRGVSDESSELIFSEMVPCVVFTLSVFKGSIRGHVAKLSDDALKGIGTRVIKMLFTPSGPLLLGIDSVFRDLLITIHRRIV